MSTGIEHERRIVDLLSQALKLGETERGQFLDQVCADEPEVRRELDAMLEEEILLGDFLEVPAAARGSATPPKSSPQAADVERLLVVDDNERNLDIMSRQLGRRGFNILTVDGGEGALDIVADHFFTGQPIALVILDIMMPGIDGNEVLRRLRAQYSPTELPIIMATARSDTADIVRSAELGANDHVGKPLDFDVLEAKIRALLRLKAAASPLRAVPGEPSHGELKAGAVLDSRFRLERKIGAGNFGTVYEATHLDLDLRLAVKILEPHLSTGGSLERFRQEGITACRVRHPHAVKVTDFGVSETGVAFLVMELLEGRSLDQELQIWGRLSPHRVGEILWPICDVLAEAHAQDLVHRDIKPENIFLHQGHDGEVVKVLDFGIAKLLGANAKDNQTADGWFFGTPAYIAPERISRKNYNGRADIYSLGIMAFEMLTGVRPFRSDNENDPTSVIAQHTDRPPPTLRSVLAELPEVLEEPIAQALTKNPDERPDAFAFASAFARGLDAARGEVP